MSVTVGDGLVAEVEALGARAAAAKAEVGRVIFGQDEVVEQVLICLLSGGHVLLVGVPGLGKSLLVETLGTVLGLRAETGAVHTGPDAGGHHRVSEDPRRGGRTGAGPSASFPARCSASC